MLKKANLVLVSLLLSCAAYGMAPAEEEYLPGPEGATHFLKPVEPQDDTRPFSSSEESKKDILPKTLEEEEKWGNSSNLPPLISSAIRGVKAGNDEPIAFKTRHFVEFLRPSELGGYDRDKLSTVSTYVYANEEKLRNNPYVSSYKDQVVCCVENLDEYKEKLSKFGKAKGYKETLTKFLQAQETQEILASLRVLAINGYEGREKELINATNEYYLDRLYATRQHLALELDLMEREIDKESRWSGGMVHTPFVSVEAISDEFLKKGSSLIKDYPHNTTEVFLDPDDLATIYLLQNKNDFKYKYFSQLRKEREFMERLKFFLKARETYKFSQQIAERLARVKTDMSREDQAKNKAFLKQKAQEVAAAEAAFKKVEKKIKSKLK